MVWVPGAMDSCNQILIVDDEPLIRSAIAETFVTAGYQVREAGTKREALDALEANSFDVILLDHCLPDAEDFALLITVRTLAPDAAVVVRSACAGAREFIKEASRLGADGVICKPFDTDRLVRMVESIRTSRVDQAAGTPELRDALEFDRLRQPRGSLPSTVPSRAESGLRA